MSFFRGISALSKLHSRAGLKSNLEHSVRCLQTQTTTSLDLKSEIKELIPEYKERVKKLRTEFGQKGLTTLLWLGEEDIGFRGLSFPECQKVLPAAIPGGEPLPEAILWLLLTGKVPSKQQVDSLSEELRERATVPDYVFKAIDELPVSTSPENQLLDGVMALQDESEFQKRYQRLAKTKYWEPTYEDTMNLIARLPVVAAYVYRRTYKDGKAIPLDHSLDYGANYSHMLGFDDPKMHELMRLYVSIHSDFERFQVCEDDNSDNFQIFIECWLCEKILSGRFRDPYYVLESVLRGPNLHGLPSQGFLRWIRSVVADFGTADISTEQLKDYVHETLSRYKVIPGYGRGIEVFVAKTYFRTADPRCTRQRESCQREFALKHLPDDPLFRLVSKLKEVVPPILLELRKVRKGIATLDQIPNVDSHSGVLLNHFGLTEDDFYCALFVVSRAFGLGPQFIWDRVLAAGRCRRFRYAILADE